ncbi:MAG: Na+/H+ antiporter subunit B [Chloroflexi bacterium]|nr:Na+/H+ antiporter subunit B [Chloroflexota bacterium]
MNSLILRIAARFLMPLLLLFSVFLMIRGHNQAGGGFAGGLVAGAAFALYSLAYNSTEARNLLSFSPLLLIAVGIFLAAFSGVIGLLAGQPFLTGIWTTVNLPSLGAIEVGTPVLFDIGVYLLVFGITLTIIFSLEEGA